MNFVFGNFYDPHGIKIFKDYIQDSTIYQKLLFVLIIILIHHFIMFSLESFTIDQNTSSLQVSASLDHSNYVYRHLIQIFPYFSLPI